MKDGGFVREIDRATSTASGMVMIAIDIVSAPDSDAIYQKLAEQILQSFHLVSIPTQ
jgi:hypothetical protein